MSSESVRLQYAELRLESLAAQVTVADSDLKSLYDKNANRNLDPEKRRARHILIAIAPGKEAEALAQANALVAEAKAGKDFSELARKNSTDSGSAAQGGDLGWAERSAFVGPFSDALFSMKENDISTPVKSQFGYHIIRLDGIQAGHTKTFEEARADLDAQYRRDKAADLFGEKQEQIQARLEQPGADFAVIAKDFGLTLGEVALFARGGGGAPLGSDKSLQDVVFGDAVLNQHRTGGPLVLGEDRLVLVKVLGHTLASAKPLAEVRDQVVAALRKERGTAAARAAADKAVERIKAGDSIDKIAKDLGVTAGAARFVGRGDPSLAAAVRDAVFAAPRPRSGAPAVVQAITLEQGGAAVFQIYRTRATVDNSNPELASKRRNESLARYGVGDAAAYIEELRRKADVTKNPKVFE